MLQMEDFRGAAGLGFEPRLTDPESVSIYPWLFTAVQKTAFLSQIPISRVSRCSPSFTPVTVKSLSKLTSASAVLRTSAVYTSYLKTLCLFERKPCRQMPHPGQE